MRIVLTIVGAILALMGGFWFLQGTNVIPVGFMAGQTQWTLIGGVLALAGVGLIIFANRRTNTGARM
jgi:hypothetical protein